jgi:hypothetical protein
MARDGREAAGRGLACARASIAPGPASSVTMVNGSANLRIIGA